MADSPAPSSPEEPICASLPSLVSSFVDTFVDFAVGGQILGPIPAAEDGVLSAPVTRLPAADRLVAIGDVHGDLHKLREALTIGGVMDDGDRWVGGTTKVVQVGDVLDRGNQELKAIYLLEKLRREAVRSGGDVIVMNGNHEIMNMEGDFRYATPGGMEEFRRWAHWYILGNEIKERCHGLGKQPDLYHSVPSRFSETERARFAALRPGGPISSRFLASHPTVLMIGGTLFVHGGLLPAHVDYGLDRINKEMRQWILGNKGLQGPPYVHGRNAVVWLRSYSEPKESKCDCELLGRALEAIPGAQRMVVGHTIQQPLGINGACSNRVIRVDVGMSEGCGNAAPEVLEIRDDKTLKVLSRYSRHQPNIEAWRGVKSGLASILPQHGTREAVKEVEVRA